MKPTLLFGLWWRNIVGGQGDQAEHLACRKPGESNDDLLARLLLCHFSLPVPKSRFFQRVDDDLYARYGVGVTLGALEIDDLAVVAPQAGVGAGVEDAASQLVDVGGGGGVGW